MRSHALFSLFLSRALFLVLFSPPPLACSPLFCLCISRLDWATVPERFHRYVLL